MNNQNSQLEIKNIQNNQNLTRAARSGADTGPEGQWEWSVVAVSIPQRVMILEP